MLAKKEVGKTLSKEQSEKFLTQLKSIQSDPLYEFNSGNALSSAGIKQAKGIEKVLSLVKSALPSSTEQKAIAGFLESEVNYFQQVGKLSQQRNVRIKNLSATIIGPSGQPIIPYAPIPMSEMQLVGWDEDGNEIYYNTDDGYYYKRDDAGGNTFTRYDGDYMDKVGKLHIAENEAANCTFWQSVYRFLGFAKEHLTFPDAFINNWDSKGKLRPNNPWFKLPR